MNKIAISRLLQLQLLLTCWGDAEVCRIVVIVSMMLIAY